MKLTGLHILLTYQCTFECDHCFAWGSPWQQGTLTVGKIDEICRQAKETGTVEWIYFEGGEPFLYYPTMLHGIKAANALDFQVGVVTNSYWATSPEDARLALEPLAGMVQDLSVSSDLFHYSQQMSQQARNAGQAAGELGIPVGTISVAQPEETNAACAVGQLPTGGAAVMYRGRAVSKLSERAVHQPWETFTSCPHEALRDPGRCHLDPLGNLHICQGITLGNLFEKPLKEICEAYNPVAHPICGPLLEGGPVALVKEYALAHEETYADACHLCYESRLILKERFPEILCPEQMYGVLEG